MLIHYRIAAPRACWSRLTLERVRDRPAISSSIFVTTTTDPMGFLAFLGLATVSGLVNQPGRTSLPSRPPESTVRQKG